MPRLTARNYHNVKRGWWNNQWYDSSWELAILVYFHDHGMEITRNSRKFPYKFGRKMDYYQPDFILEDGTYVEVKGIRDRRSMAKMSEFPYPIQMWGAREMKPYLEYMDKTYGRDWREKF